jgi:hypothetical protein
MGICHCHARWRLAHHQVCSHLCTQVALWGFSYTDIYSCFYVDLLHQDKNGMTKHLLFSGLKKLLASKYKGAAEAEAKWALINGRLREMQPLHEAFMPNDGLDAVKTCAEENAGIMAFIAVAMNGALPESTVRLYAGGGTPAELMPSLDVSMQ